MLSRWSVRGISGAVPVQWRCGVQVEFGAVPVESGADPLESRGYSGGVVVESHLNLVVFRGVVQFNFLVSPCRSCARNRVL